MSAQKNPADKPKETTAPAPVEDSNEKLEVEAALQRKTQDGKGPDPVPESDFDSFATENVEKKSVAEVADEVLRGRWGATFAAAQQKLDEAGYNVDEVWAEYQRRKAGGAPSAF